MEALVATRTFRLKGRVLDKMCKSHGLKNPHQVSMRAGVSYPTIEKWLSEPEGIESIHMPSLAGILIGALGFKPEDVLKMRIGDLFEYVEDQG